MTLLAVYLSQRWRRRLLGRALLVGSAVLLLGALVLFRDFTLRAMLTTIVPALALLVSSFAIGPMPREIRQESSA